MSQLACETAIARKRGRRSIIPHQLRDHPAATLGGVDTVVFTAGIGENQPQIRAKVCERLAGLGLEIDARANGRNTETTSNGSGRIAVFVIATDEEQVIADEILSVLKQEGVSRGVHR
jgi:acetate kinase